MLSFQVQAADAAGNKLPRFDHIVVAILENLTLSQAIDRNHAPFIYSLATGGALFVNSYVVSRPSQPNYFAPFSGSTHGIRDGNNHMFDAPNLAGAMDKPVWILNRFGTDWRWLLNRTDSPWYPTAKLHRQHKGRDWDDVVRRVETDLSIWQTRGA